MKKTLIAAIALASASGVFAKTTVFGEADAAFYLVNTENGSFSVIDGSLSEFGVRGEQTVSETEQAFFYLSYDVNSVNEGDAPDLHSGMVGFRGNYGEVMFFADQSPLGKLTDNYFLFSRSPDSLQRILGVGQANGVGASAGEWPVTGIQYSSPELQGGISFDAALIPEEGTAQQMIDGKMGVSVAGHYSTDTVNVSAAFELNVEVDDTSIFRVNGDVDVGNVTLGGTFQSASNSVADSKATHFGGFVKAPLNMSGTDMNLRVLAALNTATDAANNSVQEFYTSGVIEIPFTSKVSSYSFISIYSFGDMQFTETVGGGGLKVRF